MKHLKKKTVYIIGSAVLGVIVLLIIVLAVLDHLNYRTYTFYYMNYRTQKMENEKRVLPVHSTDLSPIESRLVKEYMLGPEKYDLRLNISDGVELNSALLAQKGNVSTLIMDFSSTFLRYADDQNDDCRWFLEGLVETLRRGTKIKNVIILVNGQRASVTVGNWSLSYPIQIRKEVKKK